MTNWLSRWGKRDDQSGKTVEAQPTIPSVAEAVILDAAQPEPSPVKSPRLLYDRELYPDWVPTSDAPLCGQIAEALDGIPVGSLKKSGVTVNTLVRAKSGEGIRLETLEKIARYLGWTITITDKEGRTLVRS